MTRQQSGFTLIELVMVIVIIGILAATALPRFADLQTDARESAVSGLAGAIRSADAIVHSQALVKGETGAMGSVTVEGTTVSTVYGYPANASIDDALSDYTGFTFDGTDTFTKDGATTPTSCQVQYAQPASTNGTPTVTVTTSGC